jgi:membrane-bound ClpP family serine protease
MDATTWALLLLAVGIVFLVLEFFVPSGGSLAVLCALSLLAAIVVGFLAGRWTGLGILTIEAVVVPAALVAAIRWWPETPIGRLIMLRRPESPDEVLPETENYRGLGQLVGRRGSAKGTMLPSGHVVIEGRVYDAISAGGAIEANQDILVIGVSTQRLVVRPDTTIRAELADLKSPANAATAATKSPEQAAQDPLAQEFADPFAS